MQPDSLEIERHIEAAIRRASNDQIAIELVEALVLAAIAAYFVASVFSIFIV
jgi:hypothetical protein